MNIKYIISLLAGGLAFYWYKNSDDAKDLAREKEHEEYVEQLLDDIDQLEDRIDPNYNASAPPVIITAAMKVGGQMLEAKEIVLNITNNSDINLTLQDFQAHLWVCGYMADRCVPSNITSIRVPARKTVEFRMYAEYGQMFSNYVDVKRALNKMYDGRNSTFMRAGMFISLEKAPVVMNLQFLWVGSSFEDECFVYDVPGSFLWAFAGWTEGNDAGYNAANTKSKYLDDTHWDNTDEIVE